VIDTVIADCRGDRRPSFDLTRFRSQVNGGARSSRPGAIDAGIADCRGDRWPSFDPTRFRSRVNGGARSSRLSRRSIRGSPTVAAIAGRRST